MRADGPKKTNLFMEYESWQTHQNHGMMARQTNTFRMSCRLLIYNELRKAVHKLPPGSQL